MAYLSSMSEGVGYEYGLLTIRKVSFDRLTYPSGTVEEVTAGDGVNLMTQWWEEQRAEFDRERSAARATWETRYQAWRRALAITTRKEERHSRNSWDVAEITDQQQCLKFQISIENPWSECHVNQRERTGNVRINSYYKDISSCCFWVDQPDRITPRELVDLPGLLPGVSSQLGHSPVTRPTGHLMFTMSEIRYAMPSGRRTDDGYLEVSLRYAYSFFEPEPRVEEDDNAYDAWRISLSPPEAVQVALSESRWEGMFFSGAGEEEIALNGVIGWENGFPEVDVVAALNRLCRFGWRVISVSEDNGVYEGRDGDPESKPVALRYLLERPTAGESRN